MLRKLTGGLGTGTASAAWTGMVDLRTADWSDDVLQLAGISRARLAPVLHPDQPLTVAPERAVRRHRGATAPAV